MDDPDCLDDKNLNHILPSANQKARYAACNAELLNKAGDRKPENHKRLGLYVLAPTETIGYGWYDIPLDKADIRQRVERRVQAYQGKKDKWSRSGSFRHWIILKSKA